MFTRLQVRNFQALRRLTLELGQLATTIVGSTDKGKSAILRALKWLCLNRPAGEAFIRYGAGYTEVELDIDGHTVVRRRGDHNMYCLDDEEYMSFRDGVPEPIADLLRVDDVNFQGQHDAPFWFADKPGDVSKQLNQIINLGVIDDTIKAVATKVRNAKATYGVSRDRLDEARTERDRLAWVPEAREQFEALVKACQQADQLALQEQQLTILTSRAHHTGQALRMATRASTALGILAESVEKFRSAEKRAAKQLQALEDLVEEAKARACEVNELEEEHVALEEHLHDEMGGVCPLCHQNM